MDPPTQAIDFRNARRSFYAAYVRRAGRVPGAGEDAQRAKGPLPRRTGSAQVAKPAIGAVSDYINRGGANFNGAFPTGVEMEEILLSAGV
jgi:hypothetical protein